MGIGALVCAADSARSLRKNIYPVTLSYQGKNSLLTGFMTQEICSVIR